MRNNIGFQPAMPIKPNKYQLSPLRIAAIYALIGGLWILLSDVLLAALVADQRVLIRISIYKGWLFVIVTAGLLFWLIRLFAEKQRGAAGKIERLNRLYRVIVKTSEAILRMKDQPSLFSGACRLAVEEGGLRMAWIGLVDEKDQFVRPAALSGVVDGYLDDIRISTDPDCPGGCGPTGIAIREGRNFICNDIESDPRMLPWREPALKRGYRSSAAFPLKSGNRILGSLNLYAPVPSFFGDEEIMLFDTLVADLSLAIESARREEERLIAEEALRQSEKQFRELIELLPIAIAVNDQQQNIIFLNNKFIEIFGFTLKDIPTLDAWWPLAYPDPVYRQKVQSEWGEVIKKSVTEKSEFETPEYQVTCGDGSVRSIQFGLVVVGELDLVIFDDITERKRADAALRESEERFRRAVDNIPDVIVIYDRDLRIQFINEATGRVTGRPVADFIGRREEEIWPPEVYGVYLPMLQEALKTKTVRSLETNLLLPNGISRALQITCIPLIDESGEAREVLGITHDLSERKWAERCLAEKEARLRILVETIPDLIWLKDPDGIYLTCNKVFEQFFGAKEADIVGKTDYDFVSKEMADFFRDHDRKAMAAGKPSSNLEWVTFAGDGHRALLNTIKTPMYDTDGQLLGVLGIGRDITEYQKLEEQLRQAQKMEAIGTLAGGIAHDFNNILTAILGFGEIVMEQLEPGSPLCEDQAQVIAAGQRARELVKQILTFSRRNEQELRPLMVQFVVKEALKLLRASIPTSIEIKEDIDVNCGLVMADPGQIHQMVMNLCTNAYQAMRGTGGVLAVSLKCLTISEAEAVGRGNLSPGNYVVLEVSDNGGGMSKAVQERIFEPYFTTKGTGEGTGLGLSLVHGIVTGLGGVINVYSELGQGSIFKVYLPLSASEIDRRPEVKSAIPPGGAESVLVVDDEEAISRLERKILEGLGYRVTVFADSEEALRAFHDNPEGYDLVLTDMTMPRLDGDKLAREIMRIRPGMPVILCTGFSEMIDAEKAKCMGIKEFLLKPVEKGELARAVRRALDGNFRESS